MSRHKAKRLYFNQESPCCDPITACSLRTMSRHREPCHDTEPESFVATKKTSIATQTRKWVVPLLALFCTSSSLFFFSFQNTLIQHTTTFSLQRHHETWKKTCQTILIIQNEFNYNSVLLTYIETRSSAHNLTKTG